MPSKLSNKQKKAKRRAKQSKVNPPGLSAGMEQGSKGPFQDQEIESSSSEDSELEDVDIQSSCEEANAIGPRSRRANSPTRATQSQVAKRMKPK